MTTVKIVWDEGKSEWRADFGDGTVVCCKNKSALEDLLDYVCQMNRCREPPFVAG